MVDCEQGTNDDLCGKVVSLTMSVTGIAKSVTNTSTKRARAKWKEKQHEREEKRRETIYITVRHFLT